MLTISKDTVAIFHYTIFTPDGEIIDSSRDKGPSAYIYGQNGIPRTLERALVNKTVGETFTVIVPPEEGYGVFDDSPEAYVTVCKRDLPAGLEFQKGFPIVRKSDGGPEANFYIHDYADGVFTLTQNHPYAGITMVFEIEIIGMREALPIEREHLHPHGLDGTSGCSH